MVSLVVGILVRHLDIADTLLDSYIAEPPILGIRIQAGCG